MNFVKKSFLLVMCSLLLAGCAAERYFSEGKSLIDSGLEDEGIAKIEQAIKEDPSNPEYRIFLKRHKEVLIPSLLAKADEARIQGRLADAETAYRQVLSVDIRNQPAQIGMEKIIVDRRHKQMITEAEGLFKKEHLNDAAEMIHMILTENPQNREAQNLDARIAEKQSKQVKPETRLAESFRKPVSLEFRDAPLRSVFEVIAKVSGINFVYDKDIRPDLKATIFVKNSSIEETIRLLSITNQLEFRVLNENSILIYPNTPQKIKDYQPLMVRSFYLGNADAKQVANSLKTLLKTKDLVINEKLNLLIMRDTPDAIKLAERIVKLEDLTEPEVMLEVEVLEVKRTSLTNLGVKWPDTLTLATPADLPWSEFRRLGSSNITTNMTNMVISAKQNDSDVKILANPRIRVKNREKASFMIGDRVPIVTTTSTSTGFVADSVSYVDVGLKLEVEPNIYLDDEISMKVQLEVSSIVKEILSKSGTSAYQIGTRNANTVLRLRDGEMQILAGLINDEDRRASNKIPGLGDLPIVGRLFSQQNDDNQKTEIVLSITPRLVRTLRRPDMSNAEFESGTETTLSSRTLLVGTVQEKAGEKDKKSGASAKSATPTDNTESPAVASDNQAPSAAATGSVSLSWNAPPQVNVGDQFSAVLNISSESGMTGMAGLVGYDPTLLQVVSVNEGDFLKKGNAEANFSNRIDPVSGKVFLATVRMSGAVSGRGSLATINFKAIKSADKAKIQLLSLTPEMEAGSMISIPLVDMTMIIK